MPKLSPRGGGGLGAKTGLYAVPLKFLERNQKNYQGDYSFTVDTVNTGGILKDQRVRRLTPTECERLQGFPDGWTELGTIYNSRKYIEECANKGKVIPEYVNEKISDSQRYKCLGNAVTVNVIEEIVSQIE